MTVVTINIESYVYNNEFGEFVDFIDETQEVVTKYLYPTANVIYREQVDSKQEYFIRKLKGK